MNRAPRPEAGPVSGLTDISGIRIGHRTAVGHGHLTGTTVVLAPPGGAVGGVDVRGGGPGTRETDLLDPRNVVERVNAVVLSGGSAFGLSAAHGVMERLAAAGEGVRVAVGTAEAVVPIVPAAALYDLGRGGDIAARPDAGFGADAYDAAGSGAPAEGNVGAGTGAVAGPVKGGVGNAGALLSGGARVAALAVVNCAGSPIDPATGLLYGTPFGLPGEFPGTAVAAPPPSDGAPGVSLHTTLGVVATDLTLTKAQCAKVAGIAHDGLARAIRPVHTMFDGDTVFALSTTALDAPGQAAFHELLTAAADCFTRACARAVLAAEPVRTPADEWRSYRESLEAAPEPPGGAPGTGDR